MLKRIFFVESKPRATGKEGAVAEPGWRAVVGAAVAPGSELALAVVTVPDVEVKVQGGGGCWED
jgi:hypothetical protein